MFRLHRSRIGRLAALAALLVVLGSVPLAGSADARVGGGISSGSRGSRTFSAPPPTRTAPTTTTPFQRTITQPGTNAPFGAPAARPFGGFFGGGLLGGLAAGFLGAGLFGLLFGHGFFGGMGGFASLLGLALQIVLVVFVARLALGWWQRRNQPAYASGPARHDDGPKLLGGGLLGAGASAASPGAASGVQITPADFDAFERLLGEIQSAYSAEDLNALRARVTPEMLSYFADDLAQNSSRGVVNRISDVRLEQGDLAEAWREGDSEYATTAMRFSLVDRMIDRNSGAQVGGSDASQEVTELWTFRRARGGQWQLAAIQQVGDGQRLAS
jgi:predicted lipid-binding transport protein (Tim44 family)